MKHIILLMCFSFMLSGLNAQDCKVLLKDINQSYSGDCKKGKADGKGIAKGKDSYEGEFKKGYPDGKGIYTWSNGDVYEGEFKKGQKNGQGKLTYKTNTTKDSIVIGFWKKDTYIGVYEKPYKKIDNSQNVTSVRFTRMDDKMNAVRIYIRKDNSPVLNPNATIVLQSGSFQDIRNQKDFIELTNVTYPLKFRATYELEYVEVEIYQFGSWKVQMEIEHIKGLGN
ncbi:hypothetical protein MWU59_09100 [Flavobacteriaceae bacterium F08102]|nr:hypothetical protein [Flavobacteriaceae bacterium F08102]